MKYRTIFMLVLLALFLSITVQTEDATAAEEVDYQQWEPAAGVSITKTWTVTFNDELDKKYVTNEYIYVTNSENERLSNVISLNSDGKSVSIQPPESGYVQGEAYNLHISKSLKNTDEGSLQKTVQMPFIIEREEIEQYALEENVVPIEEVTTVDDNHFVLPADSEHKDMKAGDIIILPADEKNPQGIAKKVESIESVESGINLTTSEPHFTEVFDEVDLYKKIKITAADIDQESLPEGVTVRSVPASELESGFNALAAEPNYDVTEVIEWKFDNYKIDNVIFDGTVRFFTPELIVDIKRKGINVTRLNINLNTAISKNINVKSRIIGHPKKDNKKDFEKSLLPVPVTLPIGGPFAAKLDLAVVADKDAGGDINITFENRLEIHTGVRKTGNPDNILGLEAYFIPKNEPNLTFYGTGSVNAEAGMMFSVGITGLSIVGVDIETSGGLFASAEGIGSLDPNGETTNAMACFRSMSGAYVDSIAKLEIIERDFGSVTLAKYKFPFDKTTLNTCQSLKMLKITPSQLTLEPGEQEQLEAIIDIYDMYDSNSMVFDIDLADMDPAKEGITFTSSDESKVKVTENGKIYVPINAKPGEVTITANYYRYLDQFDKEKFLIKKKNEITQDITITVEPIDLGELKKQTETIGREIEDILHNGAEYTDNGLERVDFVTLKDELGELATEEFLSGPLKDYYENSMCTDCDSIWFPWRVATDVWFKVLESSPDKIVIETAELSNEMTTGSFIIYTFKKVDDKWLLDDYDWKSFGEKGMGLSIPQSKDYLKNYYLNSEYEDFETVDVHLISPGTERLYSWYDDKYYNYTYYIFVIDTDKDDFTVKFFPHDGYISFDFRDFDSLSLPEREEVKFIELLSNGTILVEKDGQKMNVHLNNIQITSGSELQQLLAKANKIELEYDVMSKDSNGNTHAYVYADGTFINEWLIQQGHARIDNTHDNTRYLEQLIRQGNTR